MYVRGALFNDFLCFRCRLERDRLRDLLLGVPNLLLPSGGWVMKCSGTQHVLWSMWMVFPNQAGSLQGSHSVDCDILAVEDPGIGSGWQQSKQNWALPAVVGY
jgi:hypothetical protein